MLRRGHVRVAHAEIDDVGAACPRRRLEAVDLGKNVRRQSFYAMTLFDHVPNRSHFPPIRTFLPICASAPANPWPLRAKCGLRAACGAGLLALLDLLCRLDLVRVTPFDHLIDF